MCSENGGLPQVKQWQNSMADGRKGQKAQKDGHIGEDVLPKTRKPIVYLCCVREPRRYPTQQSGKDYAGEVVAVFCSPRLMEEDAVIELVSQIPLLEVIGF